MKTLALGPSNLTVGEIAYGCWRFASNTPGQAQSLIESALGQGLTLIDTADIYGFSEPSKYSPADNGFGEAEAVLGKVFSAAPSLRDQMVLATKGGITPPRPYNSGADYLTQALNDSLSRLQTDHVDLYLIHRPDLTTSFAETGRALDSLIESGKTRHVGVSNFTASQSAALQAHMKAPLICHQNEFSAVEQAPLTDGILDQCQERDMTLMAWSPLAGGDIATGKAGTLRQDVIDTLDALAEDYEATRSQIALAFILRHPASTLPIIGTQNPSRIAEAAAASRINLSARHWYDIIEAHRGVKMP